MIAPAPILPPWIDETFRVQILESYSFTWEARDAVAHSLMAHISPNHSEDNPFCLWLIGPLGAGKTTMTGAMLRALGYPSHLPVLSPTYTLMGDYPVRSHDQTAWYAHLDLYRLGDQGSNLEDFGIIDAHRYRGLLIEWPERAAGDPTITPTHLVVLEFGDLEHERRLTLYKVHGLQN